MQKNRKRLVCALLTVLLCLTMVPTALGASAYDRPGQNIAAITFDDGPGPYSDWIMDTLAAHNAKATFFMNGYKVGTYEKQIQRMVAEGHQIANHTWNHPQLSKLTPAGIQSEITSTAQALTSVTGLTGTGGTGFYLRPPYGAWNQTVVANAGVPVIWCTVDSGDWKYQDAARLTSYTGNVLQDGDIVIMHEIHKTTAQGLDACLTRLEQRGITLVTLEELFWRRGITPQPGVVYYSAKDTGVNRCEKALWFDESKLNTHWAYPSIAFVQEKGILTGNEYGEFTPNFPMTRGMFITALGRLSGAAGLEADSGFSDVPADSYMAPYTAWAKKSGIMQGTEAGKFDPNGQMTRQQMAVALARYLNWKGIATQKASEGYSDASQIADWAKDSVAVCSGMGLLKGSDGAFQPNGVVTRAMGAVIFQRLCEQYGA